MKSIEEIHNIPYYASENRIEAVQPLEKCALKTSMGTLVPIYEVEDHGRKKLTPVKFHKNGIIKSVSLHKRTKLNTQVASITTELVTFYPDGSLNRIFPLNGKLSGYWSETDEYKLQETLEIHTPVGTLKVKPINIQFFSTENLSRIP